MAAKRKDSTLTQNFKIDKEAAMRMDVEKAMAHTELIRDMLLSLIRHLDNADTFLLTALDRYDDEKKQQ